MDLELTLNNQSDVAVGSSIVLFQRNASTDLSAPHPLVAWRVFPLSELITKRRIHVSMRLSVAATDARGNACEQHLAEAGQRWEVVHSKTRDWMTLSGDSVIKDQIEIKNALSREAIAAQIYKDGRLLAVYPKLLPKETAAFRFESSLFIGLATDNVQEGSILATESLLRFVTELRPGGFSKAELVFTGNGDEFAGFQLVPAPLSAVLG